MPSFLIVTLLGIIEGITEFLPISSTGHLLIAEHWLGRRSDLFNIAIQAGAILAVVVIYFRRLLALTFGLRDPAERDYLIKLAVAFSITVVGGFIAKQLGFELPETITPVALALIIGGLCIFAIEAVTARRLPSEDVTWSVAVWVGLAQILAAVFPGTSRSAATIFAAMLAGLSSRPKATEFAFLVGIPTMFAATAYELLKQVKSGGIAGENLAELGWGLVVSAVVAFAAVKWLLLYIRTRRFTIFAWYRVLFGAALLLLVR